MEYSNKSSPSWVLLRQIIDYDDVTTPPAGDSDIRRWIIG